MSEIFIEGAGAMTAIGATVEETLASIDCKVSGFRLAPYVDLKGERFTVAPVLELRQDLSGTARAMPILLAALEECLGPRAAPSPTAVLLCVDSVATGATTPGARVIVEAARNLAAGWAGLSDQIADTLGARGVAVAHSEAFTLEGSGGAASLDRARDLLVGRGVESVLWGGISCAVEPAWLDRLTLAMRRAPEFERRFFVAGEAASFVLLTRAPSTASAPRLAWTSMVDPQALARTPSRADALTAAIRRVAPHRAELAGAGAVLVDLPDARALAREWTMTLTRTFSVEGVVPRVITPAAYLGETGAATLPLYCALAWQRERSSLVLSLASGAHRTAVAVNQ